MSELSGKALHVTGGCQCGAIRYRAELDLASAHLCHCRMCQKAAGNSFMALASSPRAAFAVTRGTLATFKSSAGVARGFCRDCGTPLTFDILASGQISVTLGSLDVPSAIVPVADCGTEARMPWLAPLPATRQDITEQGQPDGGARIAEVAATNRQHPDRETPQWLGSDPFAVGV